MALTFWAGKEPGTQHEAAARSRVIADFQRVFAASNEPLLVVFDVSIGAAPLDILVLKRNAVIVVEVKECPNPIRGAVNGAWVILQGSVRGKELQGGCHGNPFQQVKEYRYEVSRYLKENRSKFLAPQKAEQLRFDQVSAIIAISPQLHPKSEFDGSLGSRLPWFRLDGLDRLTERVQQARSKEMSFTAEELEHLVRDVLHCDRLALNPAPEPSRMANVKPTAATAQHKLVLAHKTRETEGVDILPGARPHARNDDVNARPIETISTEAGPVDVEDFRANGVLEERWIECAPSLESDVVLVLDSSQSAAAQWNAIWAWASGLGNQLAAGVRLRVFFMGNPREFGLRELSRNVAFEVGRNRGRVSLLGAIYGRLNPVANQRVLVAGSGRIYDLECCARHPLFKRTRFLRFGPDSLTGGLAPELTDVEQAVRELQTRVERVSLTGPGLIPHWWDNQAYIWDREKAALTAEKAPEYALKAAFLAPLGAQFRVTAYFDNGETGELACTSAPSQDPTWEPESQRDSLILRQILTSGRFDCPLCHKQHEADEVRCRNTDRSTVGYIIHDGARNMDEKAPLRAFVIMDRTGRWRLHRCNVLRIGDDKVALVRWPKERSHRAQVEILRFQPERKDWFADSSGRWRQYWPLPGGTYGILP